MNKKFMLILILVFAAFLVLAGCGKEDTSASLEENKKPIAVNISKVSRKTVESVITVNGKVKPLKEVNIISKIPGRVERINFEIGDRVKKGDILFTLEAKDIQLQVNQAEAGLNTAKAALNRTKGGAMEQQLTQLKNVLVTAETNYKDAKLNYERTKQLYEAGGASKQALEGTETKLKLSEEQYNFAKNSYELTYAKINPESIAAAEAQVQQAKAAYDIAKSQLDNTVIKAPISGVVGAQNVKVGELIGSTSIAMSIADLNSAVVEIGVIEDVINKIRLNDKARVTVKAAADKLLEGKIVSIAPVTDLKTQTYPVKIEIPNNEGLLKGGMFAEISLSVDKAENVLAVPIASIIDNEGKKIVYIVNGDEAQSREIVIGFSDARLVQVIKGLKENETVVINGHNFLQDGSKIILTDK